MGLFFSYSNEIQHINPLGPIAGISAHARQFINDDSVYIRQEWLPQLTLFGRSNYETDAALITFQWPCSLAAMARFSAQSVVEYFEGIPSVLDEFIAEGSDDELSMEERESEGAENMCN